MGQLAVAGATANELSERYGVRAADPREPAADPVHSSKLVSQLINRVMTKGKKSTAEKIVYDALAIAAERSGKPPVEVLEQAVKSVTPVLETRSPGNLRSTSLDGPPDRRGDRLAEQACSLLLTEPVSLRQASDLDRVGGAAHTTSAIEVSERWKYRTPRMNIIEALAADTRNMDSVAAPPPVTHQRKPSIAPAMGLSP